MGVGSLWEMGEERGGDGISKRTAARRNRQIKYILQHGAIFRDRKSTQRWELLRKGART